MDVIILYSVCAVCFFGGIGSYFYYIIKEKKYYKTTGKVIDYRLSEDEMEPGSRRPYILHCPVVEYVDKDGITQNIVSDDCNPYVPMYPVGTDVNLLVNPDDSTSILFDNTTDRILVPIVCVSIGILGFFIVHSLARNV